VALSTPWLVHGMLPRSVANGPGFRFTIWSQGCTLACPGCFNPETHAAEGRGEMWTVGGLVDAVLAEAPHIEGITVTGGEPLEQPAAVGAFCREVKAHSDLGIVILTGFTRREVEAVPARHAAVADADMVIAGRYLTRRHLARGLRGSSNKTYWARTDRYRAADFAAVPDVEVIITADGTVTVTGMSAMGGEIT
jgi:anaerobic ribonucleoside-triphosphate reductase activating protein